MQGAVFVFMGKPCNQRSTLLTNIQQAVHDNAMAPNLAVGSRVATRSKVQCYGIILDSAPTPAGSSKKHWVVKWDDGSQTTVSSMKIKKIVVAQPAMVAPQLGAKSVLHQGEEISNCGATTTITTNTTSTQQRELCDNLAGNLPPPNPHILQGKQRISEGSYDGSETANDEHQDPPDQDDQAAMESDDDGWLQPPDDDDFDAEEAADNNRSLSCLLGDGGFNWEECTRLVDSFALCDNCELKVMDYSNRRIF